MEKVSLGFSVSILLPMLIPMHRCTVVFKFFWWGTWGCEKIWGGGAVSYFFVIYWILMNNFFEVFWGCTLIDLEILVKWLNQLLHFSHSFFGKSNVDAIFTTFPQVSKLPAADGKAKNRNIVMLIYISLFDIR